MEGRDGMLETTLEAVVTSDLFDETDWMDMCQKYAVDFVCFIAFMKESRKGKR